jgi:hypothetical protein
MRYAGFRSWPPIWVRLGRAHGQGPKKLKGEIGILTEMRRYADRPGKLYLTVDHDGAAYVGCVFCDDQSFCERLFEHFRPCYGMSIDAIGASELP